VRQHVRPLVGIALTLALVLPLGWMWWDSRLPGTYSVAEMGTADFGGGEVFSHPHVSAGAAAHAHRGLALAASSDAPTVGVDELDTAAGGVPDVSVDLVAAQGTVSLASGEEVDGYTLNGTSPGPTIEATVGDLVEVTVRNDDVAGGIALHWHGVDVPNAQDGVAGVTQDAVMPGESHTYRWVAPDAGSFWYHSHQLSHEQVLGGLFGGLVIRAPASPNQPDQPDQPADVLAMAHSYAGVKTVNGSSEDIRVVAEPGEPVRLRAVNTDSDPLQVWTTAPFRAVAVDGMDLHRPEEVEGLAHTLPAGGRIDVVATVPEDGTALRLAFASGVGVVVGPEGAQPPDLSQPEETLDLLTYGEPTDLGFDPDAADRSFDYSIGRRPGFLDGRPGLWWSVNGELLPDLPMFMVREDDVVRVRYSNHSGQLHPMHLHGHHAVVLSRDGEEATGSPWWVDSLDVANGESYEVAFVADNPGIWMDHCHKLVHAREGLVSHLMYEGVTTPYLLGEDTGNVPE
jgi:FtsP/CotA-like multicopper oxidase with cupredoxin domain